MTKNKLSKMTKIIKYIFLIYLFLPKNINTLEYVEGRYPRVMTLSNGDILMVNSKSIMTIDAINLEKKNSYDLTESSSNDDYVYELNTIAQFPDSDNGNIIVLAQEILHFFNQAGNELFSQDLTSEIHENRQQKFYNIIPYLQVSNSYYFVLIYMNNENNNVLKYYKIETSDNTVTCKITKEISQINGNSIQVVEYGPSCLKMKKSDNTIVITCFITYSLDTYKLGAVSYKLTDSQNDFEEVSFFSVNNINTLMIKSIASPDLHSALVCFIKDSSESGCIPFFIDTGFKSSIFSYTGNLCGNSFGSYVTYDKNSEQYIYFLLENGKKIKEIRFNNNFELVDNNNKYYSIKGCDNAQDFSYFKIENSYDVVNDCKENEQYKTYFKDKQSDQTEEPEQQEQQEQHEQNSIILIKSTTNLNKGYVFDNIDKIVKDYDVKNASYLVEGNDFSFLIKPANILLNENINQVDFENCEKILKEKNNLNDSDTLTIFQINVQSKEEKVLTDYIQYKVYDKNYNEMDLSVCNKIYIKINYVLNENDVLNMTKVMIFKNIGIDVINLEDEFFNDICYPYSDNSTSSDMILSDRINDIYENVSVCDNGCKFDSFNFDANSVTCFCKVKEKIEKEFESRNFATPITSAFLDSNFGVIKCYNLVFSSKNKLKNIGFWIMTILLIGQVPFLILYILKGLIPVLDFVQDTMFRNGYLSNKNQLYEDINMKNEEKKNNKNKEKKKCESTEDFKKCSMNTIKQSNDKEQTVKLNNNIEETIVQSKSKNQINKKLEKNNINSGSGNPPKKKEDIKNEQSEQNDFLSRKNKNRNKLPKIGKNMINQLNFNKEQNKKTEKEKKFELNKSKNEGNNLKKVREVVSDLASLDSNAKILEFDKTKKNIRKSLKPTLCIPINTTSETYTKNESQNSPNKVIILKQKEKLNEENLEQKSKKNYISRINMEENLQKKPGFYNLIKFNLNKKIEKQPMMSKYILNNYTYEEAILYEKRSFLRLFYIFLLSKEDILNTFFFKIPFQLQQLRICMFIFNNSVDISLNAFFYLSDNISDKYHYEGNNRVLFTFLNNLTITFVSTIVTIILITFLDSLIQSNDKLQSIFEEEEESLKNQKGYEINVERKKEIEEKVRIIMEHLKIKIIIFFILEFLIMIFFWYYVIAFCHVYHNTQESWIIDCLVSFLYSILINSVFAFVFTILYIISVKFQIKWLYKVSMFMY